MNLIAKKLRATVTGESVEITLRNGMTFFGEITDKDDECIELRYNGEEIIVEFADIKSVKSESSNSTATPHTAATTPNASAESVVSTEPETAATTPVELSFIIDITEWHATYEELNDTYNKIPKIDRSYIKKDFNRLKAAMMNNDTQKCADIIKELYEEFSSSETPFTTVAYRFLAYASTNCRKELRLSGVSSAEFFAKASLYDSAATEYYLAGDHEKAAACAAIALSGKGVSVNKNQVFTILRNTATMLKDYNGIAIALGNNHELILDTYFTELIKHIYTLNGTAFSASINVSNIKDTLVKLSSANTIGIYINRIIDGVFTDIETKEEEIEAAPSTISNMLKGRIVKLSWSCERGQISADDTLYSFRYTDVKDELLLKKLRNILISDLTANRKEVDVIFELNDGKVSAVKAAPRIKHTKTQEVRKQDEAEVNSESTDSEFTTDTKKSEDTALSSKNTSSENETKTKKASYNKYFGMSNLQIGRAICADSNNENRFVEGIRYFEKALELKEDVATAIEEIIKCSMTISNKDGDSSYLEKAYNLYLQHKHLFNNNGLKHNTTLYDLFVKFDNEQERKACLDRILSDRLLNPNTRIHYTTHLADLYYTLAEKNDDQQMYTQAINEYRRWEQLYNESGSAHFKKIFYDMVLYRIAVCLYKTGDTAKAKETLERVLRVDKSHTKARALLMELALSGELEEEPDLKALADEFENESEETTEEEIFIECDYEDPSGWSVLGLSEKDIVDYVLSLKGDQLIPYSLAYLKAASILNNRFENIYTQLSLATDNPMESLNYSLAELLSKFNDYSLFGESFSNYCMVAAYTRGSFYYTADKDYYTAAEYICGNSLDHLPSLKKVISIIDKFRLESGKGMDYYADYRKAGGESFENHLNRVLAEAATIYDTYFTRIFSESISQRRFKLAKAHLFRNGGMLEKMVACVKDNNITVFNDIKDEFCNCFIRNGMTLSATNIHSEKIDDVIEDAWQVAGADDSVCERKSSDLMGGLRNNLRSAINKCVKLVCEWYELTESNNGTCDYDKIRYKKAKSELIPLLKSLVSECTCHPYTDDKAADFGCHMIMKLAEELCGRLDGSWNTNCRDYFFADFLRTDNIILNEKYLPELSSTFSDLPDFNILYRIRKHIESTDATITGHAAEIYTRGEENHDYGTARLIADYLKATGCEDQWQLPNNADEFELQAKKQLKLRFENFNRDVSMAFSNGQTNVSDKFMNKVEETAQYWYQNSMETKNFGFFHRLIESCNAKIHDDAIAYGQAILKQLDTLSREENIDQSVVDMIKDHIDKQLFIVAEDWMGRIAMGDFDVASATPLEAEQILVDFWEESEEIYNAVYSTAFNLRRVIRNSNLPAKDRKGGEALINNWLENGTKSTVNKVSTLLNLLGWDNIKVTDKSSESNHEMYHVEDCSPTSGKKLYLHPIPDFGSNSRTNGFNVVCLYGYSDSDRLINEYKKLDSIVGNKIILLDYALSAAERRALAKKIKQTHLAYTYLLIDRVALVYIAKHYISGANNKTLMAITLPFSYVQPYVVESSHTMPPEMFIGRSEELLSIESATGANLVFGGRQLGKSALLKKAQTEIDDRAANRYAVYIDINKLDVEHSAEKISHELIINRILNPEDKTSDWGELVARVKNAIIDKDINYLLLMLDEADEFINTCKPINYQPLIHLKDIQQALGGKFKFVMAGLHDIVKFNRDVALGKNSVITHFTSINITPFNYDDGKELLTKPLSYLGFTFDNDETVISHILSTTNYYPGLIQLYGKKLIESMAKKDYAGYNESNTPPYFITPNHIGKVLADKKFVEEIKKKFEITLALDDEYYIIALLIAYLFTTEENNDGYTAEQVWGSIRDLYVDCLMAHDKEQVESLLEELCDLNVLKKSGNRYLFRTKSFRDLLGSEEEITSKLLELMARNVGSKEGE